MMKREADFSVLVIPFLFLFLTLLPQTVAAKKPMVVKIRADEAKITVLRGTATAISRGEKASHPLQVGDTLKEGDHVKTGPRSLMEVILPDRTFLRFADNTSFIVQQIHVSKKSAKRTVRLKVAFGRTWATIKKFFFGFRPRVEVSATNAVCGVRGTVFRMNVDEDQSMLVRTYDGEVAVSGGGEVAEVQPGQKMYTALQKIEGPKPIPGPSKVTMEEWTYIVRSMQQIRIRADGVAAKPHTFTDAEDRNEWVDWNKSRDKQMDNIQVSLQEEP